MPSSPSSLKGSLVRALWFCPWKSSISSNYLRYRLEEVNLSLFLVFARLFCWRLRADESHSAVRRGNERGNGRNASHQFFGLLLLLLNVV